MPRLLDLFCCQGGASAGYAAAGFDVVGVDLAPQPRYPYEFVRGDALEYLFTHGHEFDAIHASPPCQAYSITRHSHGREHDELIEPTRKLLTLVGRPWVMENVVGAPLINPVTLCGSSFGLTATERGLDLVLRRHRLFESNVWLTPLECECLTYRDRGFQVAGVYGGGGSDNREKTNRGGYSPSTPVARELMGTPWMNQKGVAQAIPPAFTRHLAADLMRELVTA